MPASVDAGDHLRSGIPEATQDRDVRPCVRCGGDWWGGVLLAAGQREVAPLGFAESGVFSLGVDLSQDLEA